MDNKVKITLKYDDGKRKVVLYVDADEFEIFLEKDYQRRLAMAKPEDREKIKKMTPEEYAKSLNCESYNNWHKYNRHISGYIKNLYAKDEEAEMINPLELIEDNSTVEKIEDNVKLDSLRKKVYKCLPKGQAEIFWKVVIEQISVEDIAAQMGVTPRAIYLRLENAKKNLKKFFQKPSLF